MTNEETIKNLKKLKSFHNGSYGTAIDHAIKALEQAPCEDCISREVVEKITWEEPSYDDALNVLTEVRDKVRALPSVTPQRTKGKWLDKKITIKGTHGLAYGRYGCSVCKRKFPAKSNFCPDCGAKMEVVEKDDKI